MCSHSIFVNVCLSVFAFVNVIIPPYFLIENEEEFPISSLRGVLTLRSPTDISYLTLPADTPAWGSY